MIVKLIKTFRFSKLRKETPIESLPDSLVNELASNARTISYVERKLKTSHKVSEKIELYATLVLLQKVRINLTAKLPRMNAAVITPNLQNNVAI